MERWEGVRVFGAAGSLYSTALATLHTDLLRVQVDVGMQVELRQLRADDEELLCGWPNADDDDMNGEVIGYDPGTRFYHVQLDSGVLRRTVLFKNIKVVYQLFED